MQDRPFSRYAGARIRIIRELKGLTQQQLARRMHAATDDPWNVSKISRIETGERHVDLDQLGAFALALGQDIETFLPGTLAELCHL